MSEVAPANQTKERPIRKPVSEFGVFFFVSSECFPKKQGEFTKTPQIRECTDFCEFSFAGATPESGKSKRGLSKGGLSPKGANRANKGPFGAISALPPWLWEELVPIGPEKAPTSPEMAPICPEKARFSRKDFPPILSESLGLKPPFVSPPLDIPTPESD